MKKRDVKQQRKISGCEFDEVKPFNAGKEEKETQKKNLKVTNISQ